MPKTTTKTKAPDILQAAKLALELLDSKGIAWKVPLREAIKAETERRLTIPTLLYSVKGVLPYLEGLGEQDVNDQDEIDEKAQLLAELDDLRIAVADAEARA